MVKFNAYSLQGKDGREGQVVVKSATPNTIRDSLIGGGIVMAGIIYLTTTAFKHGCKEFDKAEFNTMVDLGIIEGVEKMK